MNESNGSNNKSYINRVFKTLIRGLKRKENWIPLSIIVLVVLFVIIGAVLTKPEWKYYTGNLTMLDTTNAELSINTTDNKTLTYRIYKRLNTYLAENPGRFKIYDSVRIGVNKNYQVYRIGSRIEPIQADYKTMIADFQTRIESLLERSAIISALLAGFALTIITRIIFREKKEGKERLPEALVIVMSLAFAALLISTFFSQFGIYLVGEPDPEAPEVEVIFGILGDTNAALFLFGVVFLLAGLSLMGFLRSPIIGTLVTWIASFVAIMLLAAFFVTGYLLN